MASTGSPRVSVLLPVHDGLPYLKEALGSIRAQTFTDFEAIIIDDGSTDDTAAWLRHQSDPRLHVITTHGEGMASALNRGLAMALGHYVARQDAGDRSRPDRLGREAAFLDAHPDVAVVATCANYIDAAGRAVDNAWTRAVRAQQDPAQAPEAIRRLMPLTCCITGGTVMMRRAVVQHYGGYRETAAPAHDYDLWLRLLPKERIAKLPDRLYDYRLHEDQPASETRDRQIEQTIRAKLSFVRRVYPWVPAPAGLLVADETLEALYYRRLAREFGFVEREPRSPGHRLGRSSAVDADAHRGSAPGLPAGRPEPHAASGSVVTADDADGVRAAVEADWDLLAVTEFERAPAYTSALHDAIRHGRVVQEGNLFLRHPEDLS